MEAELTDVTLAKVLENIFRFEGQPHHEIVFVFEAQFRDPAMYERSEFEIQESGLRTIASWKSLEELINGQTPLYPHSLPEFLSQRQANTPPQASGAGELS